MSRTALLPLGLLALLAGGAGPAHAFGGFSAKVFKIDSLTLLANQEWQCDDGLDNDGDGDIDSWDSDCDGITGVPTIDIGGSASPGGDDVHPLPFFFLAWDDKGSDLGLFALTREQTDSKTTTYTYEVVVSGLAGLDQYGYLKGMTAGIADTDGDQVDDVALAMPAYGTGLVLDYTDVYAGEQDFSDYSGYLYTSYSRYACSTSSSSTCTDNVAEGLRIDEDANTLLVDLGYSDYYGAGTGFYWAVDATSMRSHVAEDGGLVYVDGKSGRTYYY